MGPGPELRTVERMRIDPLAPGLVGTAVWALLLVAALIRDSNHVWTCVAGVGVGCVLIVWGVVAGRRQRSSGPAAGSDPGSGAGAAPTSGSAADTS